MNAKADAARRQPIKAGGEDENVMRINLVARSAAPSGDANHRIPTSRTAVSTIGCTGWFPSPGSVVPARYRG
jgi:hypothetical protein